MRRVQIEDIYDYRYVSAPALSPDGKKIAFVISHPDKETNSHFSDLFIYEDGKQRQLTQSHDVKTVLWLDDETLMFPSMRNEKDKNAVKAGEPLTVFYSLSLKGGDPRECLRLPLKVGSIKKLADGSFVCLAKSDFSGEGDLGWEVFEELPFWHDGGTYSSKVRDRLYIVKDGKADPVTGEREQVNCVNVCGNDVVFVSHDYEGVMGNASGVALYKDGKRIQLVKDSDELRCRWAGFWNGKPIAALSDCKKFGMLQIPEVYLLGEGEPRLLFANDELIGSGVLCDSAFGSGEKTAWDGEYFYYTTAEDTSAVLRRFGPGGLETLVKTGGTIDYITVAGGRIVCSRVGETVLSELYEIRDGAFVPLTCLNEKMNTEREISAPVPLTAVNDGFEIHGFVLKPAGYEEGKTYPAVMDVHGGPFTAYGSAYYHEMQVWASRGYFVFFCDPRGSEGRGAAFGDIRGIYGTIDYSDLMAFTDKVLETYPMIDKERLGVTGGSYGGFMTNWIIGHTDRFHAAASQRCIANWITFFGTSDIGPTFGLDQCAGDPWNDTEKLWDHSPLKYAKNIKTPTMFIHSDRDYRCWMVEGLQMLSAIRLNGVDTRLCLFHNESHGLGRNGLPENKIRRIREISDWFDKYLK